MNKEEIKFNLNEDILYQIAMLSYAECNDKLCEINEHLGDIYSYRDKECVERYELEYEKRLLEIAVKQLQNNWNELKEWLEEQYLRSDDYSDYETAFKMTSTKMQEIESRK